MPTATRQRLLDLLAIGRVANLPTVWSNVLLGNFLGWCLVEHGKWGPQNLLVESFGANLASLAILLTATTCAYLFGTFLNDWKDVDFDREHRPERAIPSGRFSRTGILRIACLFLLGSLISFGLLALNSLPCFAAGLLLLGCIVLYTAIHKRTPLAIIPMGLCRSLLYVAGFLIVLIPELDPPSLSLRLPGILDELRNSSLLVLSLAALGIFSYVAGLTLAARYESRPEGIKAPRILFWFLIALPLGTHTWWWIWELPPFLGGWHLAIPALVGLLPFLAWIVRALIVLKKSIPGFVSRALAGLCLVDLLAFPGIAATITTGWHGIDSYPLLLALFPLGLFAFSLLLQRLAPAT